MKVASIGVKYNKMDADTKIVCGAPAILAPGQTCDECVAVYEVVQDDLERGSVTAYIVLNVLAPWQDASKETDWTNKPTFGPSANLPFAQLAGEQSAVVEITQTANPDTLTLGGFMFSSANTIVRSCDAVHAVLQTACYSNGAAVTGSALYLPGMCMQLSTAELFCGVRVVLAVTPAVLCCKICRYQVGHHHDKVHHHRQRKDSGFCWQGREWCYFAVRERSSRTSVEPWGELQVPCQCKPMP